MRKIITAIVIIFLIGIVGIFILNYFPYKNIKNDEASAIGIIGGADDSTEIYSSNDNFEFSYKDLIESYNFKFNSPEVESIIKKEYDSAVRAFGFLGPMNDEVVTKEIDLSFISSIIKPISFNNGELLLEINTYSNEKNLMTSEYILGFEDENGKEIKDLKIRISTSSPTDHQKEKEIIKGLENYKKVKVFLKKAEVKSDKSFTTFLQPSQNMTIENK